MAVDHDDTSDDRDHDGGSSDEDSGAVIASRRLTQLKKRESLPSVESSLDSFINKANEKLFDVANVKPENQEDALRREIDELKKRVADAEAKAAAAHSRAAEAEARVEIRRPKPVGAVLAAFVVGAGAMFAVSFLMPKKEVPAPAQAASSPAPPSTANEPAPPVEEAAPPATAPAGTAPTAAAAPAVEDGAPAAAPSPPEHSVAANKAATNKRADGKGSKKATHPRGAETPAKTPTNTTTTPSKQDGDLYNPF
jgi:hypothetical protein